MLGIQAAYLSYIVSNAICALIMALFWARNRKQFIGTAELAAGLLLQLAGVTLTIARAFINPALVILLSNALLFLGALILAAGVEKFIFEKYKINGFNYAAFAAFLLVHAYFTLAQPNLQARNINFSAAALFFYGQTAWRLFKTEGSRDFPPRRMAAVFCAYAVFFAVRIIGQWLLPPSEDFFSPTVLDALLLVINQALLLLLTFSLSALLNRKALIEADFKSAQQEAAAKLIQESEERLNAVMEGSQLGYSDWDIPNAVIKRNERWAAMLGYTLKEIGESYTSWESLLHPEDRAAAQKKLQDHLDGKTPQHRSEYRLRAKDGSYRWILDQGRVIWRDENGAPLRMTATHTDVTERKQTEQLASRRYQFISALQETTYELISELDLNTLLNHIVRRACQLAETDSGFLDLVDFEANALVPHIGLGLQEESLRHKVEMGAGMAGKVWQTGQPLTVNDYDRWEGHLTAYSSHTLGAVAVVPLLSGRVVLGALGLAHSVESKKTFEQEDLNLLTQFARLASLAIENARLYADAQREINERRAAEKELREANQRLVEVLTENKKLEEVLREQAVRDHLTGLYNRHYVNDAARREFARAQREGYPLSVLMLDLDHLKELNSAYGHLTGGDAALRALSAHLKAHSRSDDILCRYGGDEFLILLHDTPAQVAQQRAEAWLRELNTSKLTYNDIYFRISFSAGVAAFPEHGKTVEDILLAADFALYEAKKAGRNCVRLYHPAS
ncbi:MAG: hypothetical protein Fur002_19790 [Anaerolineales bacterium]